MKNLKYIIFLIFLVFLSCSQKDIKPENQTFPNANEIKPEEIYRYFCGEKDGFKIWVVDGAFIRKEIFNEFLYGGNGQRYTFVPKGEIWIDNSINAEEYETTLAHEINECQLMAKFGMTYFDAHDSSLALEVLMRRKFEKECNELEAKLRPVPPIDFDSTQEIEDIPEIIKLKNIYRIPLGVRNGINIFVVDGYLVRKNIYPDFGFSGNDLAYHFIPQNEIWLDGSITCEETEYSISLEMKERELLNKGLIYDSAYTEAVKVSDKMRKENETLILNHPTVKIIAPLYRDKGEINK